MIYGSGNPVSWGPLYNFVEDQIHCSREEKRILVVACRKLEESLLSDSL